jgi:hypothetical protein
VPELGCLANKAYGRCQTAKKKARNTAPVIASRLGKVARTNISLIMTATTVFLGRKNASSSNGVVGRHLILDLDLDGVVLVRYKDDIDQGVRSLGRE